MAKAVAFNRRPATPAMGRRTSCVRSARSVLFLRIINLVHLALIICLLFSKDSDTVTYDVTIHMIHMSYDII